MSISTHVLDAVLGGPAQGMDLRLERVDGTDHRSDRRGRPGNHQRRRPLSRAHRGAPARSGTYRLSFETGAYFARTDTPTFYPVVDLTFEVADPSAHYHVPLLLSPFAYSTYRGS